MSRGNLDPFTFFEEQRRPSSLHDPVGDRADLEIGVDLPGDAHELSPFFEDTREVGPSRGRASANRFVQNDFERSEFLGAHPGPGSSPRRTWLCLDGDFYMEGEREAP